jgi:2-iminobutanoate/2-iminopropanoate deaminase
MTAAVLLAACTSGMTGPGGRPFVYPQGPADPPEQIETKAGVVAKRDGPAPTSAPQQPQQQPSARPSAAANAPAPATGVLSAVERPAWAVAQAAPAPAPAGPSAAPQAVDTPSSNAAPGGYPQATRYGDLLFLSGLIAIDPRTGAMTTDATIEGQTRQVMENIRAVLEANRLTMANVVSVTMMLSSINNLSAADRVYASFFKSALPSRSVLEASKLPRGALIEIAVVAGR